MGTMIWRGGGGGAGRGVGVMPELSTRQMVVPESGKCPRGMELICILFGGIEFSLEMDGEERKKKSSRKLVSHVLNSYVQIRSKDIDIFKIGRRQCII